MPNPEYYAIQSQTYNYNYNSVNTIHNIRIYLHCTQYTDIAATTPYVVEALYFIPWCMGAGCMGACICAGCMVHGCMGAGCMGA